MKSVAKWGRGVSSKRRKEKQERDGISRAVGEEKEDGKGRETKKKKEAKPVARW